MANILRPPCDEGVIRGAGPAARCPPSARRWVLTAAILGSSMAFIDGTVVNVALPVIQTELGATAADVQWIVESYALFLAALLLVGGALGDRLGRRRVYTAGIGLFAVASLGCGLAADVTQLIAARGVQGVGAALLVPGSLAIISAAFDEDSRGRAIGTWSGFTAISAAIGPLLGSWLVEQASWRWAFFLNLPLAVAVVVILLAFVPESRDDEAAGGLDYPGAGLVTIGLGGIVFGLIESGNLGFGHPLVIAALAAGVAGLGGFVLWERQAAAPMMPLALFRSRTFSGANLLTLFLYAGLGGATFLLPFNLIQVQGYSPVEAGAAFLPMILLLFLLSRWAGGLVDQFGPKLPLVVGPFIAGLGFLLFAVPGIGGSYWATFFPAVLVLGLGMAIAVAPLTTTVMGAVDVRHAGVASGINNAVSRTAALLAVAGLGLIVLVTFNATLDDRLAGLELPAAARQTIDGQRTHLAALEPPAGLSPEQRSAVERAVDEAYVAGFRFAMLVAAALAFLSAGASLLMIGAPATTAPEGSQPRQVPLSAE